VSLEARWLRSYVAAFDCNQAILGFRSVRASDRGDHRAVDYNSRRNAELIEAIETASRAALNVERINSLVYAVVMESRGVYMSTEPAVVKKYGDGLLKFNEQIQGVVKDWESIVQADDSEQFAVFKKRIEQFVDFRKELVRRGVEIDAAAVASGATMMPIARAFRPQQGS